MSTFGAALGKHAHHFRDDVARASHDHGIADPHVLALDLVLIVQGGVGHGDPGHPNRLQARDRRQGTGAPDLHVDAAHYAELFLGRKLAGHRPSRSPRHGTQRSLLVEAVDLHHDPVDVEVEPVAAAADVLVEGETAIDPSHHLELAGHREAPLEQSRGHGPVGIESGMAFDASETVKHDGQGTRRGNRGIELAKAPRRRVARVRIDLLARRALLRIEALEARSGHVHLASDLEHARRPGSSQPQRHTGYRAQVPGHLLSALPVAARRAPFEVPVDVHETRREPVELGLQCVLHLIDLEAFAHSPIEIAQLLLPERVAEREHGRGVDHFREGGHRFRAHPPGGRVRCLQIGMRGLERLELAHQAVVLGVGDLGVVESMIAVVVVIDALAELGNPCRSLHRGTPGRAGTSDRFARALRSPTRRGRKPARIRHAAGASARNRRSALAGD